MSLAFTSKIVCGVVLVEVSGKLRFLEVSLREHINKLIATGHRDFVLNLSDVPYIDSFGLGQLVTIWTLIRGSGGQLLLSRPTNHVQRLFEITKLNTIFRISREEGQALAGASINVPGADATNA